tara:strand:+ start:220 stop:369 length:150 start_codon:yes stop_codon:yes gene_type:complete
MNREDLINELESDIICEALAEFIEAMRNDADASNDEIINSVLKELKNKL